MAEQLYLFTPVGTEAPDQSSLPVKPPLSHGDDPVTSREAAERLHRSGNLAAQQQAGLEALRQCNGVTHAELGESMGIHWLMPARRLPELERGGFVRKGEPRICSVKGSRCTTWWVTEVNG